MEEFSTTSINLSMRSPDTGNYITATLYQVDGISRALSMSELVMAICLQRATELEEEIVVQMETMSRTTVNLETLTAIQDEIANQNTDLFKDYSPKNINGLSYYVTDSSGNVTEVKTQNLNTPQAVLDWLVTYAGITSLDFSESSTSWTKTLTSSQVVQSISSKMDSLNSISQKDMIELQSMTNKRDQSFDLITGMLKSINTTNQTNANNMTR